jgi:hypothetical protein
MTSTILPDKHSPKFQEMNKLLKNILFEKLLKLLLQKKVEEQELLANLYALQKKIRQILYKIASSGKRPSVEEKVLSILVKEKIFAVVDQKEKISLSDIKSRLTSGMPLFFSSKGENQNWFDGDFRNDLIILPPECKVSNGAKGFYKRLFQNLFTDAIDLDHIMEDTAVLANLVDRKIIDPE